MALYDQQRNARLRELLNRPGILRIAACTDALSALIIQRTGFEVVGISGSGSIAGYIGKPDTGLATATDMIARARLVAAAISLPVLADADTGYGGINNVRHTVRGFEEAGVSAVHIEDQVMPKRLGSSSGITVVDADEMVDKIRIACKSRRDPNFVVIGRTDAYGAEGLDGVIRRCRMYAEAGADLLYPHTITDPGELAKLAKAVTWAPLVHDVVEPKDTLSDKELEDMGYKVVMHGRVGALCQAKAVADLWAYYKEHGETRGYLDKLMSQEEWAELIDNDAEQNIRSLL